MSFERALEESLNPIGFDEVVSDTSDSAINFSMPDHLKLGVIGENIAVSYLLKKGYRILDRNKHYRTGELDIIATDCDEVVFVEVRTRRNNPFLPADQTVGPDKLHKLTSAVSSWITEMQYDGFCRIDLIAITIYPNRENKIEHIKSITEAMI